MKKIIFMAIFCLIVVANSINICSAQDVWIDSGEFAGNPVDYYIMTETYESNSQGFDVTIKTVNKNTGKEVSYRQGKPRLIYTFIPMNEQPHYATNINSQLKPISGTAAKIFRYCMNNL